ncbi:ATP-binding cassette sub-family D member 3 [Armadillidium vulgare]|nr:ATP-binding cassette sub-family D member 3 [Armadillidium vulgare]
MVAVVVSLLSFVSNSFEFLSLQISLVNNLMKFGLNKLKLNFRTRLSNHLYNSYLNGFTYYKMSNLDNRISNPDQLLTQDVEKFCDSVVDLYSNVSKPILDIMIYIQKLTVAIGGQAPAIMICYMLFSGFLLTNLRKPISRMTAGEQRLEGEFRFVNSRLITNSEEIAFYNGNRRERLNVESSFSRLVNHLEKLINFRCNMGFVDNIIAKYFATCVGFSVVAYPYLVSTSPLASKSYQERMREYYKTGRMLVKLAEAIGRLILAGRELTKLAGFTSRVQELIVVLNDLNRGHYQRTMVDPKLSNGLTRMSSLGSGTVVYEDKIIRFESVPLITPNGDVLVKELNFEVKSGMNVLVCGPNGCGKSSLFRILGGLWPVFGGVLTKPSSGKLFYIPQRPYMTLGSFRDQVIYPDTKREMESKGITDKDLEKLLERVQLLHLLQREEDGWNTISDWMDVLSGGEKQRVAMARVFYHRPQFAILGMNALALLA